MRTLRDEATRLGYHYKVGYNTFTDEYGSYRVVEGVLHPGTDSYDEDFVHIHPVGGPFGPSTATRIGKSHDVVTLLLPPEKKEEPAAPILELTKKLGRERVRADRYEKALREIEDTSGGRWELLVERTRHIAREVLDENA